MSASIASTRDRATITQDMIRRALEMRSRENSWLEISQALGSNLNSIKNACLKRGGLKPAGCPTVICLCCRNPFRSEDRVKNRICAGCKRTEAFHLPAGW